MTATARGHCGCGVAGVGWTGGANFSCEFRPGVQCPATTGAGPSAATMDRLSALDASFLRVESPTAHMHVGWLATVDLPAGVERLERAALVERIAGRLHLVPRFRQVIRTP